MPTFKPGNHPAHDMAAAARKANTPWRTVGMPWLGGGGSRKERIDRALQQPRNRRTK